MSNEICTVCDGECRCPAYLSANTEEGDKIRDEYWRRTGEATKPVKQWLEAIMMERRER